MDVCKWGMQQEILSWNITPHCEIWNQCSVLWNPTIEITIKNTKYKHSQTGIAPLHGMGSCQMARLVMMTTMATMTTIPFPTPMDGSNRHVWKVNTIPTTMPTPHLQVRHHGQHNRHPVGLLSLLRAHHRVHFPALPLICNYVHSNGDLLIYYIYIYMSIYLYTNFSSKSWKCIPQEGHYTKQKGLGACSSNTYRPWKWIHMYVCWINVSYCIW